MWGKKREQGAQQVNITVLNRGKVKGGKRCVEFRYRHIAVLLQEATDFNQNISSSRKQIGVISAINR
jgi:hypothetical protein